jgi:predicted secreted Zn-dependent protease
MTNQQIYKIIETIVLALLTCCAVALGMTSCKAWRTISTTATYTQVGDSTKTTTTIVTKTQEEYQGVKKK